MQNLHRHTSYSNIMVQDSTVNNEDYAKRAVELGHKVLTSVEHGWQGYYFQTYELAKKYNLKCVIGVEAYWVKDRYKSDKSNHHILILAKNNNGREWLNDILSEANISGYYYKPRIDLELLFQLPAEDVFITSACIAFSGYNDIDDIILKLQDYFQDNFMLEIQAHNTDPQKKWNAHLKDLSDKYHIPMIVGLDSHYILPNDEEERNYYIEGKNAHNDEETGWYMDYPDDLTVLNRFIEQNIFNKNEIRKAMDNTDIALTFDDYDDVSIFNKEIKLPTLYPEETKEQKDHRYSVLISKKFKEYMKDIPNEEYQKYYDGVKMEVQTYKDTGMVDYPLLDYAIVKDAVEHGGLITDSGRGSAVGYFTNTLCGFSKVDRFKAAIKLYPERFISTTRILETHSLPDIDLNVGTVEIFEEAQKKVLGSDHVAPMIAFGTLRKKAAFKLYARAKKMDFELASEISKQIENYEKALKDADDDEKDEISIYDYVDEQYKEYIEQSEEYQGIISDKKKAPSAYLLYQGNIRREIGLIKCKSESTKKEYITCVIDGAIAENYKFLKNDILKVDVVLLIDKVFKRIGIDHFDVNTLIEKTTGDQKVWDIYKNGYTIGVNQVEQEGSRHKCMNYKPQNISELSAFVAAIRPGFKSMYNKFEAREDFSYGIPALDNMLRTKELPVSFIFFQEQCMMVLNYAGFPMDQCYGIIKAIAKKHPEKVKPLKEEFLKGMQKKLIKDENISSTIAKKHADEIWEVINNNCNYSFNASHAFCMGIDSLYQAWQKAYYPYEFYEVLLQHYTDKGKKDKVIALKEEMKKGFNIQEGSYKFRNDHRKFTADKNNGVIYPALSSVKSISQSCAEDLYKMKDKKYNDFCDVLLALNDYKINSKQLDILIKIGFFEEFGSINSLLTQVDLFNKIYGKKILKLNKCEEMGISLWIAQKHAKKQTEKQLKDFDSLELLRDVIAHTTFQKTSIIDRLKYENEFLGYLTSTIPKAKEDYYYVQNITGYSNNIYALYQLKTGQNMSIKLRTRNPDKPQVGNIIKILEITKDKKWGKDENGEWYRKDEYENLLTKYSFVR